MRLCSPGANITPAIEVKKAEVKMPIELVVLARWAGPVPATRPHVLKLVMVEHGNSPSSYEKLLRPDIEHDLAPLALIELLISLRRILERNNALNESSAADLRQDICAFAKQAESSGKESSDRAATESTCVCQSSEQKKEKKKKRRTRG